MMKAITAPTTLSELVPAPEGGLGRPGRGGAPYRLAP